MRILARPTIVVGLLVLLMASAACLDRGGSIAGDDEDWDVFDVHKPIKLKGEGLRGGWVDGVRSGNGTEEDPFVVSSWFIDLTNLDDLEDEAAILVEDSNLYILVEDCRIKKNDDDVAIHIVRSSHVTVKGCKIVETPGPTVWPTVVLTSNATNTSQSSPNVGTSTPTSNATVPPANSSTPSSQPNATTIPPPVASPTVPAATEEGDGEPAIVVDDSENVTISDTTIVGGGNGDAPLIEVQDSEDVELSGNDVQHGGSDGIVVTNSTQVDLEGNEVSGNSQNGVVLEDSTNITVTNNSVSGNGVDGILAQGVSNTTVEGNDLTSNGGYGVALDGGSSAVSSNTVSGNGGGGGGGILVSGSDVTVTSNSVERNQNFGIVVVDDESSVDIEENTVTGDDGGDLIIVPDPADAAFAPDSNEGRVQPAGPGFDARPAPRTGSSPDVGILGALAGVLAAATLGWFTMKRARQGPR